MLGFGPISSSSISALPDYVLNVFSASFVGLVTYEAYPFTAYQQLLSGASRIIYTIELDYRAVR